MLGSLQALESRLDGLMTNPTRQAFISILNLAQTKYSVNVVETTSRLQRTYNQWRDQKEWTWSVSTTDFKKYIFNIRMECIHFPTYTWWCPVVFFKTNTNGQDGQEIPLRAMTNLVSELSKDCHKDMTNYLEMTALIIEFCCTRGNHDYHGCIAAIRNFGLENDLDTLLENL